MNTSLEPAVAPPTIYGIRHHGPGCARSLLAALDAQRPDVILLESPAETEPLVAAAGDGGMEPPVAMLVYQADNPEVAGFYPFARFSPEWQAIRWALAHGVPVRCFDLPAAHAFALRDGGDGGGENAEDADGEEGGPEDVSRSDPFAWFARADGYSDGERWWNDRVEERGESAGFFAAILEAVTALRQDLALDETPLTLRREAWMRRCLRKTAADGFGNIAVVCGAWHAPVLADRPKVADDNALLKGMPKVKVAATWTPWTHERLTTASGYGAGVRSPGWYDHLWSTKEHPTVNWLTRAARILRGEDFEGSSASVIEAVRLSESLAGLRGRPRPGLDESLEAIRAVFCGGNGTPLALLERPLLVGERLGTLPDGLSTLPLQQDIEAQQRRLRLKPTAGEREVQLDLREDGGRNRSIFLHRLLALEIGWGSKTDARSKGTFRETWKLRWEPQLVLAIVDASRFGNTLEMAASNRLLQSEGETTLQELAERLDLALLSRLDGAVHQLLDRLDRAAATAHDTQQLLTTVPLLVQVARYGDVRQTDTSAVVGILVHLTARAHIELPAAAAGPDDGAAQALGGLVRGYSSALATYEDQEILTGFHDALRSLLDRPGVHDTLAGIAVRLLRDAAVLAPEEVATRFSFALSPGRHPSAAAHWLDGFLAGSGGVLVHDLGLLALIDRWVGSLSDDAFQAALPPLRRTFGGFTLPERSRIGATVARGDLTAPTAAKAGAGEPLALDPDRARPAVEHLARVLGLTPHP